MSGLRDMSDTNGDGQIDFEEFKALVANLKDYIKLVYEKVASGANDWCCLKDADTGQMMFLNKRSGKTQKSKPTGAISPQKKNVRRGAAKRNSA